MEHRQPPCDRETALACHVATFANCWLGVSCCRGSTVFLLAGLPQHRTVADTMMKLRCQACGGRPREIVLQERGDASPGISGGPPGWWLILSAPETPD